MLVNGQAYSYGQAYSCGFARLMSPRAAFPMLPDARHRDTMTRFGALRVAPRPHALTPTF